MSSSKNEENSNGFPTIEIGEKVYFCSNGIGKGRRTIFIDGFSSLGLELTSNVTEARFIVADQQFTGEQLCSMLKIDVEKASSIFLIRTDWLSRCLKEKYLVPLKPEDFLEIKRKSGEELVSTTPRKIDSRKRRLSEDAPKGGASNNVQKRNFSSDEDSQDDFIDNYNETVKNPIPYGTLPKGNWTCALSSRTTKKNLEINGDIVEKLEQMAELYNKTNDKWRCYSYQKAISTIRRCTNRIDSFEEIKKLPGIGESLAKKIWEIIDTGSLEKLEDFQSSEMIKTINLFAGVWGCGPNIAKVWFDQGFRTLDDLRQKAKLNENQKIGLKYYQEFQERIPREEVQQIEAVVKEHALKLVPGLIVQTCGSYRRGKPNCGDVDILISHTDGISHQDLLYPLIQSLKKSGFLTDDLLVSENDEESSTQVKYFGVCLLPGEKQKHRRLDIIIVPYSEYACALLYFTGSAIFNRSMRCLAHRYNMYLSHHSLNTGVIRKNNKKINLGTALYTPTEESIFKYLNLDYRPPEERDH